MPLNPEVVRRIPRVPADVLEGLGEVGAAAAHESYARTGYLHDVPAVVPGTRIAGSALTCLNYAGDNLMVAAAIDLAEPGDVLVVGVVSPSSHGMFGEVFATACIARGIAGVVLDAGVRDVAELRAMGFPVWARHVAVSGTVKNLPGWVNVPVVCGGQIVHPGDAIVADDDGVVVVRREDAETVLTGARTRLSKEQEVKRAFREGKSPMDNGDRRAMLLPYTHEGSVS